MICQKTQVIYIYIYIYWQHFFINSNFVEHNKHFLSTYFLVDPFILSNRFYNIRQELIDVFSLIVYFQVLILNTGFVTSFCRYIFKQATCSFFCTHLNGSKYFYPVRIFKFTINHCVRIQLNGFKYIDLIRYIYSVLIIRFVP